MGGKNTGRASERKYLRFQIRHSPNTVGMGSTGGSASRR